MKKIQLIEVFGRMVIDTMMTFFGLLIAYGVRMVWYETFGIAPPETLISFEGFIRFSLNVSLFLLLIFALNGRYKFGVDQKIREEWANILWSFSAGFALLIILFFFLKYQFFSRFIVGMAWVCGYVLLLCGRILIRSIKQQALKRGKGRDRVLILGNNKVGKKISQILNDDVRFNFIGFLTEKELSKKGEKILGSYDEFEKIIEKESIDQLILAGDDLHNKSIQKIIQLCHIRGIQFQFFPDAIDVDLTSVQVSVIQDQPLITILNTRMMGWGLLIKTIADYIIAIVAGIMISPILAGIALKIKMSDPKSSVIYTADRVGKNGKYFKCLKFRSMVENADELKKQLMEENERKGGVFFKMKDDPRVTKFGKFLRHTSLDELPQIWNVLRGEMSWVGPRPHLPEEVKRYTDEDRRLIGVKPGMTGFAQINGLSNLSFEEEMKFELYYLKKWSLWLDLIIFIKPVGIVLRRRNELKSTQ